MWLSVAAAASLYLTSCLFYAFDVVDDQLKLMPVALGCGLLAASVQEQKVTAWLLLVALGFVTTSLLWPYGLTPWAVALGALWFLVPTGSHWFFRLGTAGFAGSMLCFLLMLVLGFEGDLILISLWLALCSFVLAWLVWHKHHPSKLNYLLLTMALAHMAQAVLTFLPKTPYELIPLGLSFYYGAVLLYIGLVLAMDRTETVEESMFSLIHEVPN